MPPPDVAAAAATEPGTPRDGPCQGSLHADAAAPAGVDWDAIAKALGTERTAASVETHHKQLMRAKRKQAKADAAAKVPPPAPKESWNWRVNARTHHEQSVHFSFTPCGTVLGISRAQSGSHSVWVSLACVFAARWLW